MGGLLLENTGFPRTYHQGSESGGHVAMWRTQAVVMAGYCVWNARSCSVSYSTPVGPTESFLMVSMLRVKRPDPEGQPSEKKGGGEELGQQNS